MNRILKEKMDGGKRIFGTLATSGLPMLTEMLAQCGFDVLWLDMEHTAIGIESVVNNMIAARSGGTPAWVRVPWNDPVRVKPVVDMGADGIIFPYVRTADDARLAVASCAYPPEGIRGYGPLRASDYGRISQTEYVTKTSRECLRIIQIEHIDAVNNLQEIVAVEGIDGFIVGPNDLAGSVGKLGQLHCPEMMELYRRIGETISKTGKPLGIYAGSFNADYIQEWIDMGYTMFFTGSDCGMVFNGATAMLRDFNKAFRKED
jgi:2-dehydro-3-deoxyglucarate aldolase/4-hydroxy-2-oxoheptanedioate aldolase